MPASTSLRVYARRLLGRPDNLALADRQRIAELEARVVALGDDLRGVADAVDRLHATVHAADPEFMREVVESLRDDVRRLLVDVNTRSARTASGV